ncbi:MAG: phosphate ABC transporter permease PstA [Nocardioides sp.]
MTALPIGQAGPIEQAPVAVPLDLPRPTHARHRDDVLTLVGAALGALGATWVLYEQVLPFSGRIGFVVCAYLVFMLFYAGLTALTRPWAIVVDRLMTTIVAAAPAIVGLALADMVLTTVGKGLSVLVHPNFYTHDMSGVRPTDAYDMGGILHAIVGTLIEVAISVSIALPLGVTAAIYMSEVGGRGSRVVRTVVEAMTALPSIVAGLFVYSVLIIRLHMQPSGLAASLALAVMGLPIMARASDVVLRVVPGGLREASYALGAGRWQTVWRVVLPTARPGLATALILGIARMVGETSPLLLTSGATNFLNTNPLRDPMTSLPLYVYTAVKSGEPTFETRGYAAATVLLLLVLTLFLLARFVAKQRTPR